jgi:endoglucanase
MDLKQLIKTWSEIAAPSGYEDPMREALRTTWADLVDDMETDGLGSLIATQRGTGPEPRHKIMLCAHMDEIGMLVAEINDGFIRTAQLYGIDYRVLLMQPVLVHGRKTLPGVFGAAPPHMARSRKKYPGADELWIDLGLPADQVAELVRVGDLITFDAPSFNLKGEKVVGKSLDNRVSLAALTLCLEDLRRTAHAWDVVAVASVQEEVGLHGATTAAYQVQPDIAIAIDTTFGMQSGVGDDEGFTMGGGPTLGVGPNFHTRLNETMRKVARQHEAKIQTEVLPGNSGTDAWEIQVSRDGIPTMLLSIPVRNMHSPVEIVDLRDVRRTGRLLAAFIAGMEPDFLDQLAYDSDTEEDDDD